jgi:hypothetical protein
LNKSLALLLAGRMAEGWELYEWRWINRKTGQIRRDFRQPLWLGDAPLQGKTILLHGEQGLGNTVQFSRYAQQVADLGCTCVAGNSGAAGETAAGVAQIIIRGEALPDFDFHTPLLSLRTGGYGHGVEENLVTDVKKPLKRLVAFLYLGRKWQFRTADPSSVNAVLYP